MFPSTFGIQTKQTVSLGTISPTCTLLPTCKYRDWLILTLVRTSIIQVIKNGNQNVQDITTLEHIEQEFLCKKSKININPFPQ